MPPNDKKGSKALLPKFDAKHREEWLKAAASSNSSKNLDVVLSNLGRSASEIGRFKTETFEHIYDSIGSEVEGTDLARVLVVRNEKFGRKTTWFLAFITLGIFLCFRPRDDDTVCVLTNNGRVLQLKVERPSCCPAGPLAQFFVFMKYVIILGLIFWGPILLQCALTGRSVGLQMQILHLDVNSIADLPGFVQAHRLFSAGVIVALFCWIRTLLPHDYRDRSRRRHMVREVSAAQYRIWGWSCCRRSNMKLFFGTYPSQAVLDFAGKLGNAACCGPVPPSTLSTSGRPAASAIIVGLTLFISILNGVDTAISWGERSVTMEHAAQMALFCASTDEERTCNQPACQDWLTGQDFKINPAFCKEIYWETENSLDCLRFMKTAPCCLGCTKGAYEDMTDEGTWATAKDVLSLITDVGTLLFTLVAARYALGLNVSADCIDVIIKRRSKTSLQMEIAKFDNTHPVCTDFMESVFESSILNSGGTPTDGADPLSGGPSTAAKFAQQQHGTQALDGDDGTKWSGVMNFQMDAAKDWEQFFAEEKLLSKSTDIFSSQVRIPRKALGIGENEKVLAAWAELPLFPFNMSIAEFLGGGLFYDLLPVGKTRHIIVVTSQRVFYVRYRRPSLPFNFLGVSLRVDCFRHDSEVWFGLMYRTRLNPLHKLLHQTILRENFMPGAVAFQTRFGALHIGRQHGECVDVYNMISQLSRNTQPDFMDIDALKAAGLNWERCQEGIQANLRSITPTLYGIIPQEDDGVQPSAMVKLAGSKEQLIFHASFRDIGSTRVGRYTNTDIVITSGRLFLWERNVFKKFDCQACCYWLCCWNGLLNLISSPLHLHNSCSFFTLPSLLSFSTDLSVDPPSWFEPHHQPLRCDRIDHCTDRLTRCLRCDWSRAPQKSAMGWCPRRTGPGASTKLVWRLRQSSHAAEDFVITHNIRPFVTEEVVESDAEDVYRHIGIGNKGMDPRLPDLAEHHEEILEALRRILGQAQA